MIVGKDWNQVKKTIIFVAIILISLCVGFGWTYMENYISEVTHPMKYSEQVEKYSDTYGVPEEIIYSVIKCESSFKADAKSKDGAIGLMQIMPATFEDLCRRMGEQYNESLLYDPEVNIKYGTFYLSYLYSRYGVWETVFAAYNAGYGRVDGWLDNPDISTDGRLENIPFEETKNYVERVSDARKVYSGLIAKNNEEIQTVVSDISADVEKA